MNGNGNHRKEAAQTVHLGQHRDRDRPADCDWSVCGHPRRHQDRSSEAGQSGKRRPCQKRGCDWQGTPITKVEVKSKASGIVKKLYVDYGDRVKKGQLLAQLDKVEIEAQVAQSHAALDAARQT